MPGFQVGDFVVEKHGTSLEEFGVVTYVHDDTTLTVQFPHGRFYTFASYCQPYKEWLDENF